MTTIAYHKDSHTIAVDSRTGAGLRITSDNATKYYTTKSGELLVLAGSRTAARHVAKTFPDIEVPDYCEDCDVGGLLYDPREDEVYEINWEADKLDVDWVNENESIGSGSAYALAAMHMGASAAEAIKVAMEFDVGTGGTIHVFDLHKYREHFEKEQGIHDED